MIVPHSGGEWALKSHHTMNRLRYSAKRAADPTGESSLITSTALASATLNILLFPLVAGMPLSSQ